MAYLFYRNTSVKISFDVLDENNDPIGLSTQRVVYWYIKTPDSVIISNDPNIENFTYANGIGSYTATPDVSEETPGTYYINYTVTKIGEYQYKFQVVDDVTAVNMAVSGDLKVVDDGIF